MVGDGAFPCTDYVFELSYMTGAFIYTDLMQFTLVSQTPTLTTLRYKFPYLTTSWDDIGCVEGIVQIQGVTYTLKVVNENDPNDILSSISFVLGEPAAEVGTDGATTLLSQAIIDGDLLSAPQALNNPQSVVIHGTLIVDEGYRFGDVGNIFNLIAFAEGAKIVVDIPNPNEAFTIDRAHLFPCGESWEGIKVLGGSTFNLGISVLEKANIGVELMDNANLLSYSNKYRNCKYGIASLGSNLKNIGLQISHGLGSHVITDCEIGLKLENVENLISITAYNTGISFSRNSDAGIDLTNCNFRGSGLDFRHNKGGIVTNVSNNYLKLERCVFSLNDYGVSIGGSVYSEINDCTFQENTNIDIARVNLVHDASFIWNSNFITDSEGTPINIWANLYPSAAGGVIQNNNLKASNINVFLNGITGQHHNWSIQHNTTLEAGSSNFLSFWTNVVLFNTENCRIFRNLNSFGGRNNFVVAGGNMNAVGYNQGFTLGDNSTSLRLQGSPGALIYCNDLEGEDIGLSLKNNCNGSIIRGNQFQGMYSMSYGTPNNLFGSSSEQYMMGNRFYGLAINYSMSEVAQVSQYIVPYDAVLGSSTFPNFISSYDKWFHKNLIFDSEYMCPPGVANPIIGEYGRLLAIAKTNMKLLDAQFDDNLTGELGYDARLKLYRALTKLEDYQPLDEGQQEWKDNLSELPIADFIKIEQLFDQAISLNETEAAAFNGHLDNIRDYSSQADDIVWYEIDTTAGDTIILFPVQKAIYDGLQSDILEEVNGLAAISQPKKEALLSVANQLIDINENISNITTTSGQFQQIVNRVLFKRYLGQSISSKDIKALEPISKYCVGNGGEAVYTARALLSEYNYKYGLIEYNDECIQVKRKGDGKEINKIKAHLNGALNIYPNPAMDLIQVSWPMEKDCSKLEIYNMQGKLMKIVEVNGQNTLNIDITALSAGVYFIKMDNAEITTQKFEVIK